MAETVAGGLRDLVGYTGKVIKELDAGAEGERGNPK